MADQLIEDPTKKAPDATEVTESKTAGDAIKPKGEEEASMTPEQSARIEELNQQLDLAIEAANELNAFLDARKAEHRIVNEDFAKDITPSLVEITNPATPLYRKWEIFSYINERANSFRENVIPPIKLSAEQRMRAPASNIKIPDISGEHAEENNAFASELEKIAQKIKALQDLKREASAKADDIQALRNSPAGIPDEINSGIFQRKLEKEQETENKNFTHDIAKETVQQLQADFEEYNKLGEELEKKEAEVAKLRKKETGWLAKISDGRKKEVGKTRHAAEGEVSTLQFKRSELSRGVKKKADAARRKIDEYFSRPETNRLPFTASILRADAKNARETLAAYLTNLFRENPKLKEFAFKNTREF